MSMTQHIRGLGIGLSALAMWSGATLAAEPPPPTAGPAAPAEPEAKDIPEAPAAGTATPIGRQVALIPEIGKCHREPLQKSILEVEKKKTGESDLALQREREDFDRIYERFRAVSLDYQGEVSKLLAETFEERQASVNRRYTKQSKEASLTVRQRRLEAITRFERFVQKYPSDAEHTPDAMFRLAELYYERSAVDFDDAEQRYATEKDLFDRGKIPSEPRSPVRDYSDSVKLYQTMLSRFGDTYRYADAVYYLLGYVLEESGQDLEARKAWLALVNRLPKSEYAPEIFLRVGENHFDYGEFAEAAEVYKRALAYTDSRFYDKALYKLAWTYFQIYDYDSAILTFKDLIAWYDTNDKSGSATASALRAEAIDYLAKSLAEDDWDNDGLDDPEHGVGRALAYLSDGKPFENDIVAKYAESLYDLHDKDKYAEAITVYNELIRRDPNALEAVTYQQQIIKIYDILRDIDQATRERRRLAEMFAPGSRWAVANRANLKKMQDATQAVENAMRRRALFLHQRAQELKAQAALDEKPELLVEAFAGYKKASVAYQEYLTKYPNEPTSYEMRFYLAETLYYSDQFSTAAATYFQVAGNPHQGKFREPAAWSAVKSYERLLRDAVSAGHLPPKADPNHEFDPDAGRDKSDDAGPIVVRRVVPQVYPKEVRDWMASVDFYVLRDITRSGNRQPQAAFAYQAADLAARFNNYNEARSRFRQVVACFPENELAVNAMKNILNTYKDENDIENLEKWADITVRAGLEIDPGTLETIRTFKLGAQFQRAEALLDAKRHLEAAREFERIADANPDLKFLDKAYYNSAVAYKEVKYYDSASRIFEKLVTDPRFRNSEFKNDSLFELAENYKLFFNFEKAVTTYRTWLSRTAASNHENRPYAMFTTARLQEYSGELSQAAATYQQYAEAFQGRDDAANAMFRAAAVYGQLKQLKDQRSTLRAFVKRYETKQGMSTQVLNAMLQLAQIAEQTRNQRDSIKLYKSILREYSVRGHQPGTAPARTAANAKFQLVERDFKRYAAIRLKGSSQKRMSADVARKQKLLGALIAEYKNILTYQSYDWTIAAAYRLGDLYREFAQMLYAAPQPVGLSEEELEEFITQIENLGLQFEDQAIVAFEQAVIQARRLKVTNAWAEKALEAINRYKPADYPLYKETKRLPSYEPVYHVSPPGTEAGQ